MIRKKVAFFAEEALKRATDTMWGLSDIKITELLQKRTAPAKGRLFSQANAVGKCPPPLN